MKLHYDSNGFIHFAVFDSDEAKTDIFVPDLNVFEIDELPENTLLCRDVGTTVRLRQQDVNGFAKYYIENGELYERDGWEVFL